MTKINILLKLKCIIVLIVIGYPDYIFAQRDKILLRTCDTTLVYFEVYNPKTGRVWLDRNLGAFKVADSSKDFEAYGSLYQWGRPSDGHECVKWENGNKGKPFYETTNIRSDSTVPGHANFITISGGGDWLKKRNKLLWDNVESVNNPCPPGFRLPTKNEWQNERLSWYTNNRDGAIESALKLPTAGMRFDTYGQFTYAGSDGLYWANEMLIGSSSLITFYQSGAREAYNHTAFGHCVRCIKDAISDIEYKTFDQLSVFPNPFTETISIKLDDNEYIRKVTLYNSIGIVVKEFNISSDKIDLSELRSGFYILKLNTSKGFKYKKLIKE